MDATVFSTLSQTVGEIITKAKTAALAPEETKTLRRMWRIGEAAQLLGFSEQHLRKLEGSQPPKAIPKRLAAEHGRYTGWTLQQINEIRDILGVNPYRAPSDPAVRVAVTNFKGGVGKTTTSGALAQYLALHGYRVLCVDVDSQGSLTAQFVIDPDDDVDIKQTLLAYLEGEVDTLEYAITRTYWPRIDLIPANLGLYSAEFYLPTVQAQNPDFRFWSLLDDGLKTIEHNYDVVIIDCPPSLGYMSINAIWSATGLVVPIPPGMKDLSSARQFFTMLGETLETIGSHHQPKQFDFTKILVSKYDGSNPAKIIKGWMRQGLGSFVLDAEMATTTVIQTSDAEMTSPYEMDPSSFTGSSRTLKRALDLLDGVNTEILQQIRLCWPSQREDAAKAAII